MGRSARALKVSVDDPFGAARDAEMPSLALALDPGSVREEFKRGFPRLSGTGFVRPKAIRVTRYKPGRRCLVEYDVGIEEPHGPPQELILIGKLRASRYGNQGYRQLDALWNAGFGADAIDGTSVPEPVGVIPRFQMWFQRKVPGETVAHLLPRPGGVELARRIAEAIHKLHRAGVPTEREHTMADELRILGDCLDRVVAQGPEASPRIRGIREACERLAASVPAPRVCGVHRDFYPGQVVADGARLYLIDFDLYCAGDPALDVGNFIGHMTEQSLRELGDGSALAAQERALEERFVELAGEGCRGAVRAYAALTLARHIYLSTQFPERRAFTEAILGWCERRLRSA